MNLKPPTQLLSLTKGEKFTIKPQGRIYIVVDHVISIHDKKVQYILADTQGQTIAFRHSKLVHLR